MRIEIGIMFVALTLAGACSRTGEHEPATSAAVAASNAATRSDRGEVRSTTPGPIIQASTSPNAPIRILDPRADEILRAMSRFIASTRRFAFEAEETHDELSGNDPRVLLSNVRRVAVERPNRFYADVEGDSLNRSVWLDGRSVSTLDKPTLTYSTFPAPGSIDVTLDVLIDKYGLNVPLAELFYSDAYSVLTEQVTYSRYLGLHRAAGVSCHHLVFSQPTIEWQLWIEAGDRPLPRKMVITYVREPGEPQYNATITKWNLTPSFPEGLFSFEVPDGAEQVEAAALIPTRPGTTR